MIDFLFTISSSPIILQDSNSFIRRLLFGLWEKERRERKKDEREKPLL